MDNNMIFTRKTLVDATHVDRWGRMRPASLLEVMQETAGDHAALLGVGREQLDPRGLFWAIVRQTIEIHRLPGIGETVLAETWPGPPSRTADPRYMVGRTPQGEELFRAVALWLLMDVNTRAMVLPSGSGIQVPGLLRGGELANPMGLRQPGAPPGALLGAGLQWAPVQHQVSQLDGGPAAHPVAQGSRAVQGPHLLPE